MIALLSSQQYYNIKLKWGTDMTWSLVIIGSLTAVITVVALGWIWAESKPRTFSKARPKDSNGYVPNEGMEEWNVFCSVRRFPEKITVVKKINLYCHLRPRITFDVGIFFDTPPSIVSRCRSRSEYQESDKDVQAGQSQKESGQILSCLRSCYDYKIWSPFPEPFRLHFHLICPINIRRLFNS